MKQTISTKKAISFIVLAFIIAASGAVIVNKGIDVYYGGPIDIPSPPEISPEVSEIEGFEAFVSEKEMKDYLKQAELTSGYFSLGNGITRIGMDFAEQALPQATGKGGGADRVSETNVQVQGIDEPDIVKTNGKEIFLSGDIHYYGGWIDVMPRVKGETKIINAFPPADLELKEKINEAGNLLLKDDLLVIFTGDSVLGYDVSDPNSPIRKWSFELEDSYIVSARLYGDDLYFVSSKNLNSFKPCPIRVLYENGSALDVKCSEIYHPTTIVPVNVTYTALKINVSSGSVKERISFVGSSDSSLLYMSKNALYLGYFYFGDFIKVYYNFFKEKGFDLVPNEFLERLNNLASYDISQSSKMSELHVILQDFYNSLSSDERLRIENEIANRMSDYLKEKKRELEKSGIVKVSLDDFKVKAVGNVPGKILNQFSIDEYEDNLRVAVSLGERGWLFGGSIESANDVYVLNKDMEIIGEIKDLGLTERIYSARFVGERGYLVTFRQTDPFYILDLSDPNNPEMTGELKIPGYSSYLHPITEDIILGIGKEGSQVKLSLFDVSNPSSPKEKDKYVLSEYWSDILNTHHAFLLDDKHEIFFLPGSRGGYVFSYGDNSLRLERTVSNITAKRAVYLNDYLYIIGTDKIVVLNEIDWEKVNTLDF